MRIPIIKDSVVVNVVEIESGAEWTPPEGHSIGIEGGQIGDTWDGSKYTPPVQDAETDEEIVILDE